MNGFLKMLHAKTIEPRKRLVAGQYGWAHHRFPIKGGISIRDTWHQDIAMKRNSLLDMVVVKAS